MSEVSARPGDAQMAVKICVYAFSSTALFFRGLIDACTKAGDPVEWSIVQPQGHFRYVFDDVIPDTRRCYLYDDFERRYRGNSPADLKRALTSGEGLPTALLKDKDGYRWLDKREQLRRGSAMDAVYRNFLERIRPDFILFPDLETVDGFILMNLCRELKIGVLYYTNMRFLKRSFLSPDAYESLPSYFGAFTDIDVAGAEEILKALRERRQLAAPAYENGVPRKPSWFRRLVVSNYLALTSERLHASEETFWMRITRHFLRYMNPLRRKRFELFSSWYFDVRDVRVGLPEHYVFYALQYTPESSINGIEPYYVDQTRIIDALLLNLPAGFQLLVKEHPAMCGMRPRAFYRELRRRPGVVLIHPQADTRTLIERAAVVCTVTGTIGLECYILDKPCVLFGRSFFAHLCASPPDLHRLRRFLEDLICNFHPPTEREKVIEIAKLLNVGGDFVIYDPWYSPIVMAPQNIRAARDYLWNHMMKLRDALPNIK